VPPEAATEDDDPAVMLTQLLERVAPILEGFATAEQVYHETLARITADYKAALHTLRSESQLWEAYRRALDRQMDAYAQIQQTWAGLLQRYQAVLLTLPSPGQAQR
jgi:hypothetical protein